MPTFLFTAMALLIVWLVLIFSSKKTRFEQLLMSLVGLFLAPAIFAVAANDYRSELFSPVSVIKLEDFLFIFCLFGIAAVIYDVVVGQKVSEKKYQRQSAEHFPVSQWLSWLIIVFGIWSFITLAGIYILSLTSIQALIISSTLVGTYIVADQKDLLVNALISGILTALLVFLAEQIFFVNLFPEAAANFWQFERLSGFTIGGIPFEEILWAAVIGFAIGPLYEFIRSLKPSK